MIRETVPSEARVTGRTLLHYNIVEKLGEGGMGVVWKARDTHLDRFVAVKVLPAEKLKDAERRRRFTQEAKAASALNHPNIIHIYDIAEAGGVPFIAMEYVAGKTLGEIIGRKGLRVAEALRHGVQIAEGLDKAHSAGIIHRDLKPSNIMVTADGLVKLLDFGLAKLTEPAPVDAGETRTLREEKPDTEEGTVVGTVAYMSPEQAEGEEIDARSDIFSFGAVLYEMVTGRRAFHGDSKLSTLSAILKEEPALLPKEVPRELEKIIARCLRKDPSRRFQHAGDLKLALLELKEESDSGKLAAPGTAAAPSYRVRVWWLLAAAVLVGAALAAWMRFRVPTAPRAAPRMVPLTSYPGQQRSPALSPDGKQVAFAWDGEKGDNFDIYVKLVDGGSPLRLTTNPAEEDSPAWSPDGSRIAFLRFLGSTAGIVVIPSLGGTERKLGQVTVVPELYYGSGLSWSPDGKFLAVADRAPNEGTGIYFVSTETGEKHRVTSPPREYSGDSMPSFAPDGRTLAFVRARSNFTDEIYVLPLAAGVPVAEPRRITSGQGVIGGLDWTADGGSIVFSAGAIITSAIRIVSVAGQEPEPLAGAGENGVRPSVARRGSRLVYDRLVGDSNIWRLPGPRSTQRTVPPQKWIASTQSEIEPQYSPDGKKIVFSSARSGTAELWTCDSNGGDPAQLASGVSPPGSPRWSPDSHWIAFDGPHSGNTHIFVISAEGGAVRRLTQGAANNVRPSWSVDGKWIYFGSNRSGEWQVWRAPGQGGDAVQITKQGGREAFESPDGKRLLYTKYQKPGIWSLPLEGGEESQVLEKAGQDNWAMAEDGICFFDLKNALRPLLQFYSFRNRRSTTLYELPQGTQLGFGSSAISVSPDERWILYTQIDQAGSNLVMVENFR